MDPITIVSLAASLVTIVDTLSKVSKGIIVLRRHYRDAPEKLTRLQRDVENLQALIEAIHTEVSTGDRATNYPKALSALSQTFADQLQQDLHDLQSIVDKVNRKSRFRLGRDLRQKTQYVLAEDVIAGFQGRIATHVSYLGVVQTLIGE
jgi:peptidoglycan hydrolase CwlO-like protein